MASSGRPAADMDDDDDDEEENDCLNTHRMHRTGLFDNL